MTAQEKQELIDAVKRNSQSEGMKITEVVFKFISTLSMALVMWTLSTVNSMQKDMIALSSDAKYMREAMTDLKAFTAQPHFTQEDFDSQIKPMIQAITLNTDAVTQLKLHSADVDLKIQQLQFDVSDAKRTK